jgi:HEAT repeat protein
MSADDRGAEAALAIAGTRSPEAVESLRQSLKHAGDPWWRSVLLSAIALTRQDAAIEFLLDLVQSESLDAEASIETIVRSVPSEETLKRLKKLVSANPRLARVLEANLNPRS